MWLLLFLGAALLVLVVLHYRERIDPFAWRQALRDLGPWAPMALVALFVVQQLLPVFPNFVLIALAGLLFGFPWGVVWSCLGGTLAAAVLYVVGQVLGRGLVTRLVSEEHLLVAESMMLRRGAWSIVGIRMLPVLPSNLISYMGGILRLPLGTFLLGTAIGGLPGTVLYTVLGERITQPSDPVFWLALLGLVAMALTAFLLDRRLHGASGS